MQKRSERHLISRPSVNEVFDYRKHIDHHIRTNIDLIRTNNEIFKRFEIGLNHEEQHIELLLTDLKFNFYKNPIQPPLFDNMNRNLSAESPPLQWISMPEGIYNIGAEAGDFCFDNESSNHRVFLESFSIANRLTTNSDYLDFINDSGYKRSEFWLSEGISWCRENNIEMPMYWKKREKSILTTASMAGKN